MGKYLTNIDFIDRSNIIHNYLYDYSLTKYVASKLKVKIICSKHGIFEQIPNSHLQGIGCPKCSRIKISNIFKKPLNNFINEAAIKHNNKYDYSLVDYVNSRTKIKIICPKHGIFEQTPNTHLKGNGCVKCRSVCDNPKEFIEKSEIRHNYKYDYSLVNYKNNFSKVKIICPEHGIFEQLVSSHLNGNGCLKCFKNQITTKIFIEKAKLIENNTYDYSLTNYINSKTKVKIICPEHGIFEVTPANFYNSKGCPICSIPFKTIGEFIENANKIHNYMYDYSLSIYAGSKSKIKIICPKHGIFEQIPNSHLQGAGCPKCNQSRGEIKITEILIRNNILFETQKTFNECKNHKILFFDFYLPEYNICIEYDGIQHFEPIEYFGGEKELKTIQERDAIKNKYCKDNYINLLRIRFDENIEDKLKVFINNLKLNAHINYLELIKTI